MFSSALSEDGRVDRRCAHHFLASESDSHRCIDCVRKKKLHASVALDDAPDLFVKEDREDPLLSRRVRALLASLPEKPRMVMILRYQEDMMPEEIANILEMR